MDKGGGVMKDFEITKDASDIIRRYVARSWSIESWETAVVELTKLWLELGFFETYELSRYSAEYAVNLIAFR